MSREELLAQLHTLSREDRIWILKKEAESLQRDLAQLVQEDSQKAARGAEQGEAAEDKTMEAKSEVKNRSFEANPSKHRSFDTNSQVKINRSEGVVAERRIFCLHALQGWSGREPRFLRPYVRTSVRAAGRRPAVPPFPKNIKTCANVPNRLK